MYAGPGAEFAETLCLDLFASHLIDLVKCG